MGVSYPNEPQGNVAWFREQLAGLRKEIQDAVGLARTATSRGGVVGGSLSLTGPVTPSGIQVLQRRGKLVTGLMRFQTTAAIAQYGVIGQLPPGFRPDPAGNDLPMPGAYGASSTWSPMVYYVSASDGVVRPLTGSLASGSTLWFTVPAFVAGA